MRRTRLTSADSADQPEAGPERQRKAEHEIDDDDRRRLADDGKPAEPDQRVEAERAGAGAGDWGRDRSSAAYGCAAFAILAPRSYNMAGGVQPCSIRASSAGTMPPPVPGFAIEVAGLTKLYKGVTAVDGISFSIQVGSITGTPRRQRRRQDHHHRHDSRADPADRRHDPGPRPRHARERHRVLHRMNFESPYVALPQPPDRPAEPPRLRHALRRHRRRAADRGARRRARARSEFLDREAGKISAGQKTRVALAKALINAPELLLLDEPTASLDPDTGDWIRTRLETYRERRGATILLASHNMPEVERLCDDVIMMKAGRIVDRAAPQTLIDKYGRTTLEDVFLDVARGRGLAELPGGAVMNAPFLPATAPVHRPFSARRIGAMMLRHVYLLRSSWPRLAELIYWPLVQMLMWGFLQSYLNHAIGRHGARPAASLIGAHPPVGHPHPRPARPLRLVPRGDVVAQHRQPAHQSAHAGRSSWLALMANELHPPRHRRRAGDAARDLVLRLQPVEPRLRARRLLRQPAPHRLGGRDDRFGGLILRNGIGAENLAWTLMFLIMPVCAVFYPVAVLPRLPAADRLGAAADLRLRGHARASSSTTPSAPTSWSRRSPSTPS